ncbi:MAG: type IV toxin-antitoxin system AbiEi family antitoxin domain-containing protein [Acidobacteriota bacterium]
MQTLTEKVFRLSPPGGLFDETVVRNLFGDRSEAARKVLVHRAVSAGEIIRLKPGLFLLAQEFRKTHPHPFVIAAMLHSPSHVSLESALAHHGLIPEAVYQVASVTSSRSRTFNTSVGIFSFKRVPAVNPRAGVRAHKIDGRSWTFVATPLRAIADLIYTRKEVSWEKDGLVFLTESMRIERDDLENMSFESLSEVSGSLRDRRTADYLRNLFQELRK